MKIRIVNRPEYSSITYDVQVKKHWYSRRASIAAYPTLEHAMNIARKLKKEKRVYHYGKDFT